MLDGEFKLFAQLTKVDEAKHLVYGRATEEVPDGSREIIDIAKSWPRFEKWSMAAEKRSGGKSKGNIREMHEPIAAGKLIEMQKVDTEDGHLAIDIGTYCSDPNTWQKILDGTLTGFSIGGKYAERRPDPRDPSLIRYVAEPREISYVDAPAVPTATYKFIKADGMEELRKFVPTNTTPGDFPIEANLETLPIEPDADTTSLEENAATSGNRIVPVPAVAGSMLSTSVAQITGASPAEVKAAADGSVEKSEEIIKQWTSAVTLFGRSVEKLTEMAKAEQEKNLAELKQRGSSVGIARREGGPLTAPNGLPADWRAYADPANWNFPIGDRDMAKLQIANYNAGKGRENYTTREWHVVGRRIARLASDVLNAEFKYSPTMTKVEKKEDNPMKVSNDMQKADLLGLLSQVNAALSSAVDMMGKDPSAARSLLMSVLGNLDDASGSSSPSLVTENPQPPMNEQQDASVSAIKADVAPSPSSSSVSSSALSPTGSPSGGKVPSAPSGSSPSADKAVGGPQSSPSSDGPHTTPAAVSSPSASLSPVDKQADASAIAPSSPSSSSLSPAFTPSVPGETGDSYVVAMQKQMAEQADAIKALTATVEKLLAQSANVAKTETPALDLNSIVDGISQSEDPVIAAVLANDIHKAESLLGDNKGDLQKRVNEAVQKSLAAKPFFGAQHIYSPAAPSPETK